MKKLNIQSHKFNILLTIGVFIFMFLPYIVQWQNSYVQAHDNLDSDVVWYKTVAQSGKALSIDNSVTFDNIMNGLPRNSMPSGYSFLTLLFYIFSPFTAYLVNMLLVRIAAFVGMYLLLRDTIFTKPDSIFLRYGIALAFTLLPFYGTHPGIAISGIPLVIWCFYKLFAREYKLQHFVILAFFSLYSSLIYTGIFILIFLGLFFLVQLKKLKKIHWPFFIGMCVLVIGFIISELHLISQLGDTTIEPHRGEFYKEGLSVFGSIKEAVYMFLFGQYHAASKHIFVLVSAFFALLLLYKSKRKTSLTSYFIATLFAVVGIAFLYGIWDSVIMMKIKNALPILKLIQWHRFYWLLPAIWFIVFAMSSKIIVEHANKYKKLIVILIIVQSAYNVFANKQLLANYYNLAYPLVKSANFAVEPKQPTYAQFYDVDVFNAIKDSIAKPQKDYRVVSIGIPADVAIYNGFYALDSYQRNYPLAYKHSFRNIIGNEIEKDSVLLNYYDNWGSRCYVFSAELGIDLLGTATQNITLNSLSFNTNAFREMGGEFVFSAHKITNTDSLGLSHFGTFTSQENFWTVWVYKAE